MKSDNNEAGERPGISRRAGLIALALVLCAAAFLGFKKWNAPEAERHQFHKVKRGDMLISIVEGGALRAVKESIIRSEFEGISRIISIVAEGTYVKAGQVVVELDSSELKDRVNQQDIAYQNNDFAFIQSKENLSIQQSLVESQIKEAELRVEFAKSDLDKYIEGDAPQQINTATNA
ncbi:MAG TPA: hypothetical protein VK633_09210, partial [Verrucomicrobiae bacterium]|nr:hypothetical protein [Verrucomicrobiae bacterium]